ncbi:MAG: ferrous iron transport protein A [Myxococcales bacterium]|nr:ferrous iron transport protein A [Myxococcales bacterium]
MADGIAQWTPGEASGESLINWRPGAHGHVVQVARFDAIGERLAEMGLTPGVPLKVLRRAPFGGPMLVRVRDFSLSLRLSEAAAVVVRPVAVGPR